MRASVEGTGRDRPQASARTQAQANGKRQWRRIACGSGRAAVPVMAAALVALTVAPAPAQDTISTDRPGLGFSPSVVPTGDVQVELGLPAVERTADDETDQWLVSFPVLLRVGATKHLELRLGTPLFNLARDGDDSSDGFGPVELGAKIGVAASHGGPELALIPSLVLPIGHEEFAGDRVGFSLHGIAGWPLPSSFGLTTVTGLLVEPSDDDDYDTTVALVAVLGRSLTERLSAYVEAGWFPTWGAGSAAFLGGFVTFLLTDRLQIDGFFDRGLNSSATDWSFGTGISVLF